MFQTIQACRAIAAFMVVLFHAGGVLAKDKYFGEVATLIDRAFSFGGRAGVAFFFVLSGFIISHVHHTDLGRPNRLLPYIGKRIKRIFPIYWIVFLAVYCSALAIPSLRDTVPSDPLVVLKSLLLLPQDKAVLGRTGAPVLDVAWTLQYEMIFYAVFALAIVNRKLFYPMVALYLANYFLQFWEAPYVFPRLFFAHHLIFLFLFGMAAASVLRRDIRLPDAGLVVYASICAFAAVAVYAVMAQPGAADPFVDIAYGVVSAILIVGLVTYERGRRDAMHHWSLGGLGDASYVLYLVHFPLISVLCKALSKWMPHTSANAWAAFVLIVAICVLAGLLFHLYVERPLLRLKWGRRPAGEARIAMERA